MPSFFSVYIYLCSLLHCAVNLEYQATTAQQFNDSG